MAVSFVADPGTFDTDSPLTRLPGPSASLSEKRLSQTVERLAAATEQVGCPSFPAAFAQLLQFAGGYENMMVAAFFDRRPPRPVFSNLAQHDEQTSLVPYFARAYLEDPWYALMRGGIEDGVFRLTDHVGSDFTRSRYYREYYRGTRLRDECGIFVRPSDDALLIVSLGLRPEHARAEGEIRLLRLLLPCIRSLCRLHWADLRPSSPATNAALSRREQQVCDLVLAGRSNKEIARALDLSPETVKIYRRRMNRKLNVGSTRELFAMLLREQRETGVDDAAAACLSITPA